jgi:hypothetical protein
MTGHWEGKHPLLKLVYKGQFGLVTHGVIKFLPDGYIMADINGNTRKFTSEHQAKQWVEGNLADFANDAVLPVPVDKKVRPV